MAARALRASWWAQQARTLFACVATAAFADIDGKVAGISDGDALTVLEDSHVERKVRLAGIDEPEKGQVFGNRPKQSLSDCAFGQRVHVVGHKSTDMAGWWAKS